MPRFPLLPPVFPFSLGFSHHVPGRGTPQDSASNFPAELYPHMVAALPVLRRTKGLPWAPRFRAVPQGDHRHGHRASGQIGTMTVAWKAINMAFGSSTRLRAPPGNPVGPQRPVTVTHRAPPCLLLLHVDLGDAAGEVTWALPPQGLWLTKGIRVVKSELPGLGCTQCTQNFAPLA